MPSADYRTRIYRQYVVARCRDLAPASVEGLKPRAPSLRKIIREHFPADRGARILDLGCGHGAFLHFAREAGYTHVSGVDDSAQQVAEAKRLGIEGVTQGDLRDTLAKLPDGSHDVIIAYDVIEHFHKDELIPFVDHVFRVLRDGGVWIVHTPNGEAPFVGRVRYGDFTHEITFTRVSITQLLLASGFTRVVCREDTPIPHGLKSGLRWLLWKGIRGGLRLYLAVETGAGERESIFTQNFLTVAVK
jgi:SAM-dependent methyltransferase